MLTQRLAIAFLRFALLVIGAMAMIAADSESAPPPIPAEVEPGDAEEATGRGQNHFQYHIRESASGRRFTAGDADIRAGIMRGNVARDDLVWRDGLPAWTKAEKVPELQAYFRKLPPKLPIGVKHESYLYGSWQATIDGELGRSVQLELRFSPDGRYVGVTRYMSRGSGINEMVYGKWQLATLKPDKFALVMYPEEAPAPGVVAKKPEKATHTFVIVDENMIYEENDRYYMYRQSR